MMENSTGAPASNATVPTWTGTSTEFRVVSTFLIGVVCVLGAFGNIMVVLVLLTTRPLKTSTSCYLVSLAVADLMVLTAAGVPAATNAMVGYWVYGSYGCSIITFFQYLGINASSTFIAAFTIDRYITVCHPFKAQSLCTVYRAKVVSALVWILTSLYCTMWLFLAGVEEVVYSNVTIVVCGYKVKRKYYMPIYFVDFGVFFVLPLLLASILYGLIGRILCRHPLSFEPTEKKVEENAETEEGEAENSDAVNRVKRRDSSANAMSRRQVTKMLAVVVMLFGVLWMPYRTLVVVNSFLAEPYVDKYFLLFCRLCIYLNSAINPIIYGAMFREFRVAVLKFLPCGRSAVDKALATSEEQWLLLETTNRLTTEMDEFAATARRLAVPKVEPNKKAVASNK